MDAYEAVSENMPEIALVAGGVLAILIAAAYLGNNASLRYRLLVAVGVIAGALMVFSSVTQYESWELSTAVIVAVAGFALAIRPFRDVHFSVLFAVLVMAVIYILLGSLSGGSLDFLSSGWPRVGCAFAAGAVVYMMFNFAESLIKLFGKLFNCWPVLILIGLVCIAEAVSLFLGHGSLYGLLG
jgi:hypothetical protein